MQRSNSEQSRPAEATDAARSQPLRAIGLMCLAWVFFSCIDATAKYLATRGGLPLIQVVWVRFVGQLAAMILVLGLIALPRLIAAQRPGLQLVRSLLLLASTVLNFMAIKTLRLDQTIAIQFLTPLTVALLAGPILGEWVGWRRMLAVLVGFAGILVAVRPGFVTFEMGLAFSFGSMFAYAFFSLITRHLATHDSVETTLFYSLIAGTVLTAPFAFAEWVWPSSTLIWSLVATIGLWAGAGHFLFILAHRYAPASTIAPFIYVALITHSTFGYLVFGQVPDAWTLAGAGIVIASGLYLLHRERVRARDIATVAVGAPNVR
jgi:drug/metabolite transporter (DMT)-like permease